MSRKKHRSQAIKPISSQIQKNVVKKFPVWLMVLPALVVLVVYLPAIRNGFVWDDIFEYFPPEVVNDPGSWLKAITGSFEFSIYFRPLTLFSFLVEMKLLGKSGAELHFMNVLLMAFNAWVVTLLAGRLITARNSSALTDKRLKSLPLVAGLAFGLHPVLIEGVVWISSRFDLMMTGFILLALLADFDLKGRRSRPMVVGLLFLLAALCKESAIAFVFILPLWHLATHADNPEKRFKTRLVDWWSQRRSSGDLYVYLALLVAGILYLVLRQQILGYLYNPVKRAPEYLDLNSFNHMLLIGKTVATYAILVLFPFISLSPYHAARLTLLGSDTSAWIGLILGVLIIIMFSLQLRRPARATWLLLAGFAALLPVLNILPLGLENFVGERFLLLPVSLLTLSVVDFLLPNWQKGRMQLPAIAWGIACIVTISVIIPHWKDDLSFWTWASQRDTLSALPSNNLSSALIKTGEYEAAAEKARYAASLNPSDRYEKPWVNLGHAYFNMGRYGDAIPIYQKAIELKTNNGYVFTQLPQALIYLGRYDEAEDVIKNELFKRAPDLPIGYMMLANVYAETGRPELAVTTLDDYFSKHPLTLDDNDKNILFQVWLLIGSKLYENGDLNGALAAYRNAENSGAPPLTIGLELSGIFFEMGNYQEMERVLLAAIQVVPGSAELYNDLGVAILKQGDYVRAREYFEKAIELNPEWEVPRNNLKAVPTT